MQSAIPIDVVFLGAPGIGKTSIIKRFLHGTFLPNEVHNDTSTSGAVYYSKVVVINETAFKFKIWDTSGLDKYKFLLPMYYRNARAAIVCFDLSDSSEKGNASYARAKEFIRELKEGDNPQIIALAGLRSDIPAVRNILPEEVQSFVGFNELLYASTSAKEGENVTRLFAMVATTIRQSLEKERGKAASVNQFSVVGINSFSPKSSTNSNHNIKRSSSIEISNYLEGTDTIQVVENDTPLSPTTSSREPRIRNLSRTSDSILSGNSKIAKRASSPFLAHEIHNDNYNHNGDGQDPRGNRPTWVKDEVAKNCSSCCATFGVFLRKHHCRNCGNVFCADCSSYLATIISMGYDKPVRVCKSCNDKLLAAK